MIESLDVLRSVAEAVRATSNKLRFALEHARGVADEARVTDSSTGIARTDTPE
jgi:hypothetical protein